MLEKLVPDPFLKIRIKQSLDYIHFVFIVCQVDGYLIMFH